MGERCKKMILWLERNDEMIGKAKAFIDAT